MPLQPEKLDCDPERLFDELEALRQNNILLQECVSISRKQNEERRTNNLQHMVLM